MRRPGAAFIRRALARLSENVMLIFTKTNQRRLNCLKLSGCTQIDDAAFHEILNKFVYGQSSKAINVLDITGCDNISSDFVFKINGALTLTEIVLGEGKSIKVRLEGVNCKMGPEITLKGKSVYDLGVYFDF